MNLLKILYISTFYGSSLESGAEKSTRIWAKLLRNHGFKVRILTLSMRIKINEKDVIKINKLIPDYVLSGSSFLDNILAKYIRKALILEKPDIIHVQDLFSLPPTISAKNVISKPIVVTIRDPLPKKELGLAYHPYYILTNFWLRRRQPIWLDSIKECDGIVAISNFIRESLKKLGFEKNVEVIYNPIIVDDILTKPFNYKIIEFVERLSKRFKILFSAARMHYEKGIDTAIKSLKSLPSNVLRRVILLLAGNGPYLQYFKKLAKDLRLENRVIFLGYIDHRTVLEIYKYSFLTLLLSRFEEPLGRTAIESMYFGTPVIATGVGGLKEVVLDGKTGFLVKKNDFEEVAEKIEELLSNEHAYLEMKKNSIEFVRKKFNNEKLIHKMTMFYESLI